MDPGEPPVDEVSTSDQVPPLRCPQCGTPMEEGALGTGHGLMWKSLGGSTGSKWERITDIPYLTGKPWFHGYRCRACSLIVFEPGTHV
jgi:uncharacterized protein DUF6487